jgi:hypothetical protein
VIAVVLSCVTASTAQEIMNFNQLPNEVRDLAIDVRKQCKDLEPEMNFTDMQGIQILSLTGDNSRDIFVDNEDLCGEHIAGANCSNRGCDVTIYKEVSKGHWQKIFHEHLYAKFLAIDWETMRFQLMVASIFAGDPRCQPRKEYTSGYSCNLIVTFKNNRWNWQKIP